MDVVWRGHSIDQKSDDALVSSVAWRVVFNEVLNLSGLKPQPLGRQRFGRTGAQI